MNNNLNKIIKIHDLKVHFPINRGILQRQIGTVKAVDGITLDINFRETFGIVGESGCGKSTTGRAILQLYRATSGSVIYKDLDLTKLTGIKLRKTRREIQMIFQDPYASLNPRMKVGEIVEEPMIVHKIYSEKQRKKNVDRLFELVGLNPGYTKRYPHEFSGGQRQRIGIARALSVDPEVIICDEPISALDVSIQAQIINLLIDLQEQNGLTYIFIAHDLNMVGYLANRVAVMYLGKLMEIGFKDDLFENPLHPYTKALLSAAPDIDENKNDQREKIILEGDLPNPADPPKGCVFCTRCNKVMNDCKTIIPEWREIEPSHWVACHLFN